MVPSRKDICERMKSLRGRNGYIQDEVAERLNMSQNAYSELESGKRKLDIERLFQIAEIYSISVNSLLHGLPPPPR
ncbi:MAG: helix-turn-helix transcriptional regulator [Sphingobacteriales bacterium]|nr:helix-turn-helix transcriptional regulator [Sphingobacteriales bacterium]